MTEEKEFEIAEDLYENFEEITGYKPEDVVEPGAYWDEFDEEIVNEASPKLEKYALEKYEEDISQTEVFYKLDDMLLGNFL